jgi:hypothetical protein
MKMDATGLYLINNGVIQRYHLPKVMLVYLGSSTSYVTPNGFETDISLFSKANCFDVILSLSTWKDAYCKIVASSGWDIVTKQLGTGLYELIGMRNGGDSLCATLQIFQDIIDTGEETVTIQPDPLDAAMLASCEEDKTTFQLPYGCGIQTISNFMWTGKLPEFTIYPNPVENSITIQSSISSSNVQCNLFDQLGRSVLQRKELDFSGDKKVTLDVSNIPSGIYILRMETNGISRDETAVINH